jgi:hypothetical protein
MGADETRMSERDLAINLSYVLHEPSDSSAVARAIRDSRRRQQLLKRAFHALDSLPDDELRARTTLTPCLAGALANGSTLEIVYMTHTGAWQIAERLLHLCGVSSARPGATGTTELVLLDGVLPGGRQPSTCSFFRGAARLVTESRPSIGDRSVGYIAAVVRPGNESIMLSGGFSRMGDDDTGERCSIPADVLRFAERHIRDFVAQWQPPRALWDEAAEMTLPELTALRRT